MIERCSVCGHCGEDVMVGDPSFNSFTPAFCVDAIACGGCLAVEVRFDEIDQQIGRLLGFEGCSNCGIFECRSCEAVEIGEGLPRYSRSVGACWPLVDRYWMTLSCMGKGDYMAHPSRRSVGLPIGDRTDISASAETAPLAICLAALKVAAIVPPAPSKCGCVGLQHHRTCSEHVICY